MRSTAVFAVLSITSVLACGGGDASGPVDQIAAQLGMQTEPSRAVTGQPFTVQPIIEVRDADGDVVSTDDATIVTATIDLGGGTLGGTVSSTAVAGVATFTDLQITGDVGDRTLRFTAPDITAVTSDVFPLSCGPPGIVSWWPGDGNASDVLGLNDGTLMNGTTFAAGKVGQAFSFDGVDDFVDLPGDAFDGLFPGGNISIEAWMKTTATGDRTAVMFEGNWLLFFDAAENGVITGVWDGDFLNRLTTSFFVADDQWHHVVSRYSGGTGDVYVDGTHRASGSATPLNGAENRFSGGYFGHYVGLLDEVAIYDRALTATEIQAIFNAGSAGKCGV